ncbi:zinc-binding dehydrogenase [Halomarina litorea]|uniref:zinc-binding dehydrogenase n=1 Tax=Halomarina litorea TaxID=2961595 RepID=UPI0020C44DEA|nr:zinc-binding dehydrogenase [Halomarina sp. BCD28]
MKAAVITDSGGPDVIEIRDGVPRPEVGPGDVLVKVAACAVNHTDIWVRRGVTDGIPPIIPGLDIAGEVAETGANVSSVREGERVVVYPIIACRECEFCTKGDPSMCVDYGAIGESRDGGHAEYVTVPATNILSLPDSVSFTAAAAAPSSFGTAWRALMTRGNLTLDDDVLVVGASGCVGHAAVQIAANAGARVLACTSTDEKATRLRDLGADHTIDYTAGDIDAEVKELTDGRGVDLAVESVGGDVYKQAAKSLARGSRLVTFGATTGDADEAMLQHIFWKQLEVVGSTGDTPYEFQQVMERVFSDELTPVVDSQIPLSDLADAHERLENRGVFGKIIVKL